MHFKYFRSQKGNYIKEKKTKIKF